MGMSESLNHFQRFLRALHVGAVTYFAYKIYIPSEAHIIAARSMLGVAEANRGLYVKAGQVIASMNHILPASYTATLAVCQDSMPAGDFDGAAEMYTEETGRTLADDFERFDRRPVATASIAQVFRGRRRGEAHDVAVKVQHPRLQVTLLNDIYAIETVFWLLAQRFPDFDMRWLMPEFKRNLMLETNFVNEADNCRRTAELFARESSNVGQLYAPRVLEATRRLLVMEWIDGVKVTDRAGLAALGVDRRALGRAILGLFADQTYLHGFLHSDPHPGNLLVRRANGRMQVVLLDHGLYRSLREPFRLAYCRLWRAMVLQDAAAMRRAAADLGAADLAEVLAMMVTKRPLRENGGTLDFSFGDRDREGMRRMFRHMQRFGKEAVSEMFRSADRDLLLVLRSAELVRSLLVSLEMNDEIDRFKMFARSAVSGLHHRPGSARSWPELLAYIRDRISLEARLILVPLFIWYWRHFAR